VQQWKSGKKNVRNSPANNKVREKQRGEGAEIAL